MVSASRSWKVGCLRPVPGAFYFTKIFGWKFQKLCLSNGNLKAFQQLFQTCNLIGIKKCTRWCNDGTRRQQNGIEILQIEWFGTEKDKVPPMVVRLSWKFPFDCTKINRKSDKEGS